MHSPGQTGLCGQRHRSADDRLAATSKLLPEIVPGDYDAERTRKLAGAMGLLTSRDPRRIKNRFFAKKIPVTEYLVGRYLSDLANGTGAGKRAFIEIVRR